MSKEILLKNGTIISPKNKIKGNYDIYIRNGKIEKISSNIKIENAKIIDCSGYYIFPGFIDLHTHLREPGREDEETIETGSIAAAAGGFTTICAMPNTEPVIDNQSGLNFIKSISSQKGVIEILPIAAVTKGQKGEQLVEFGDLVFHGAIAFSDDGNPIKDARIMRLAMTYCMMFDVPIMVHAEEKSLTDGGIVNSGEISAKLGLKGMPAIAEAIMISRDLFLHKHIPCPLHFCHVSCKESVELIEQYQNYSNKISAEVTPHHLTLTEKEVETFDTNLKMNPPLRTEEDRQALISALKKGIIKAIATDHAPHTQVEKEMTFPDAPFGVIGLETAFPVIYTDIVKKNLINLETIIERLTSGPAEIIKIDKGILEEGKEADLCIWDLEEKYIIREFNSKSNNSPFIGKEVYGKLKYTIKFGEIVYKDADNR